MSELKVNSIKGTGASTAAITIDSSSGACSANITNNLSNRNLIINGAMQVALRHQPLLVMEVLIDGIIFTMELMKPQRNHKLMWLVELHLTHQVLERL